MFRFLAIFSLVLLGLFLAELTAPVQRLVVVPWTGFLASASAFLLRLVDANVLSHGNVLQDMRSGSGIAIEAGCNGVEACIMLAAALMAYPAGLRSRMAGLLAGSVAIQLLNLLRIISLYYLVQWSAPAFEFAHLYLWQALIMLDVLVVWLVWLRWVTRRQYGRSAPPEALAAPA
ncbi:exosortase H [Caenimonas terrae]|uniref:Exosortase H n=1 Tax=Caenimonas terrae TaxID=696074 RepID=A0ABW0NAR0_9BURK